MKTDHKTRKTIRKREGDFGTLQGEGRKLKGRKKTEGRKELRIS